MAKKPTPKPKPAVPETPPRPKACSILPDTTLGDDIALVAENMEAILSSPSYGLAQEDRALMERTEMRGVRMLLELNKPELALREHAIASTVIVFGGTQIVERGAAERRLSEARRALQADPADARLKREVDRSQRLLERSRYYDAAREFARLVSIDNQCDDQRDFVIVTGGGPGIMEAANRGAADVPGGRSVGLGISLPFEEQVNRFVPQELAFEFHYFFMRKYWFAYLAKAMVVMPGGFGTCDEMFEILTLRQTGKIKKRLPMVLFGKEYWNSIFNLDAMVEWGTINEKDLLLMHVTDSVDDAFQFLTHELSVSENRK